MFLAMGVGAYAAGIFHLYTHAFFKALLFLGSGAVIHALAGEQDLRHMGGLKKYLPITYWTFLIGALAIAGVPLLSGFFCKDEILFRTFVGRARPRQRPDVGHRHAHVAADGNLHVPPGLPGVPWRAPRSTRGGHGSHGGHEATVRTARMAGMARTPHDAPPSMAIPLIVLAIGSVFAGLRRRPARARREQPDRDVPPSELRSARGARERRSRPRERAARRAQARRRARRRRRSRPS